MTLCGKTNINTKYVLGECIEYIENIEWMNVTNEISRLYFSPKSRGEK